MDHKFTFMNFEPQAEDVPFTHVVCEKILDMCPADATLNIDFVENGDHFVCHIRMTSFSMSFHIDTRGPDMRAALLDAREKALELLAGWHKQRFNEDKVSVA